LPAWAGQPHETSFAAPKAKGKAHPKAKAKALANRAAGETAKGSRPKGGDPELDMRRMCCFFLGEGREQPSAN